MRRDPNNSDYMRERDDDEVSAEPHFVSIRNEDIAWTGGYPHVVTNCGAVHLLKGAAMAYGYACGVSDYDSHYTKLPLNCLRCAAVAKKEQKAGEAKNA